MAIIHTITTVTDPDDSTTYLDVTSQIDGVSIDVEYSFPPHLVTTVSAGGAAAAQPVVPLANVGDLDVERKIDIAGTVHEILSVDDVLNEVTLTANLATALVGAEVAQTTDASISAEVEENLTSRGYTWA